MIGHTRFAVNGASYPNIGPYFFQKSHDAKAVSSTGAKPFIVQALGLTQAFTSDSATHDFIKKLLALPFLPAEHITTAFLRLNRKAPVHLQTLCSYVYINWVLSEAWPPTTWSCFMSSVRTNNDVEGWHRRINFRAHGLSLGFYALLELLYQEARLVVIQAKLVSEKKLIRYQRQTYKNLQTRLFNLWEQFNNHELSTYKLLKACSHFTPTGQQ